MSTPGALQRRREGRVVVIVAGPSWLARHANRGRISPCRAGRGGKMRAPRAIRQGGRPPARSARLSMTDSGVLLLEGPVHPAVPLLLDSPHSGRDFPSDFDAAVGEFDLRDGEDCFVDELYRPATERGAWLLATRVA